MDFKIPEYFSRIIREVDAKNSNDINKAIRFLVNKLHKIEEFEEFKNKIKKLKKVSDKEKEEKIFLEYLNKEFLKQQREYDERRKIEQEEKRKAEAKFQEKMRLHELKEKLKSLDWDDINNELKSILSNLRDLFNENNNSNSKKYSFYNELYNKIDNKFAELYKLEISYFFKQNYSFKADSNYFKLDELKNIISEFEELESSNFEISINIAEKFLDTRNNDDEIIEGNIILAIKIAHTIFMNYKKELKENFDDLRKYFDSSVSDELIYVALFVNNNYIDGARTFIEKKKNSWEETNDVIMPESKNNSGNTKFSKDITQTQEYNIRTHRSKTEAEIIQQYDEEANKLNKTQQNYILFNGEKYDVLDFISNGLNNEDEFYQELYVLFKSELRIENLKMPNDTLSKKYRILVNSNLNAFKRKYLKYKIFEEFTIKFSEILSGYNVNRIYNSNNDTYDVFINLILFGNYLNELKEEIIYIPDLNVYLKIIACVIVKYFSESKKDPTSKFIAEKITDPQEKQLALQYIKDLFELFQETDVSNEDYFKLFVKVRENKQSPQPLSTSGFNTQTNREPAVSRVQGIGNDYMRSYESQLHVPKSRITLPKKNTTKNTTTKNTTLESKDIIYKGKKKATDEDKIRIIFETFGKMVDIDLSNKITEQTNFKMGCNQTSLTTLQTIYQRNNHIFSQLITLLSTLKSRINIDKKKRDDYCFIFNTLSDLRRLLTTILDVLISTINKEKESIKLLFKQILENIDKYIKIYEKLCSSNNEEPNQVYVNKDKEIEYLNILGIDIQAFSELDKNEKIKEIKKSYKRLALEKHPNKVKQNSPNMNKIQENQATAVFQEIGKAYLYLSEIYSNGESNNGEVNNAKGKLNMGFKKGKPSTDIILISKSLSLKNKGLLDIIVENLNPLLMFYLQEKQHNKIRFLEEQLTNLKSCYLLFTPFNALFDDKFEQRKNPTDRFILLLNNDKVKKFESELIKFLSADNIEKYQELCHKIELFIRYINYGVEFTTNNINKEKLNDLVYYNFFNNLNNIIEIILKSLDQENPNYSKLKFVQTALGTILTNMKKDNKELYVFRVEKNNSGTEQFVPNSVNTKKFGREEIQQFKVKIKKEISKLIEEYNNSLNDLTEELLKQLIQKMNDKYKIEKIKISRDFLNKLKTTFRLDFSGNIDSINIEEIINKIVIKLTNSRKHIKESILEFLYIYVSSFSKQERFKIFEKIKEQKSNITKSSNQVNEFLSNITKKRKEEKTLMTKIADLKRFETSLQSLGRTISDEQKLLAYETKAKEIFKIKTDNELSSVLSNVNTPFARKYIETKLLLTEGKSNNVSGNNNSNNKKAIIEQIKELFKQIFKNENTSLNISNKTTQAKFNEVFNTLVKTYDISFKKLVQSQNLDDMIRSFFDKINKVFGHIYKKEYVNLLINELKGSNNQPMFLPKQIIIPTIRKVITDKLKDLKNYEEIKDKILMLLFIFVESFSYPKHNKSNSKPVNTNSKLKEKNKLKSNAVVEPQSPNNSKFNIRVFDTRKAVTNKLLSDKSKKNKEKMLPRIKEIIDNIIKNNLSKNNSLKIKSLNEFISEAKKRLTNLNKK